MKTITTLFVVLLACLVCALSAGKREKEVLAKPSRSLSCIPSDGVRASPTPFDFSACGSFLISCPQLDAFALKERYYEVLFPGDPNYQEANIIGTGSCNPQNPSACWPTFFLLKKGRDIGDHP